MFALLRCATDMLQPDTAEHAEVKFSHRANCDARQMNMQATTHCTKASTLTQQPLVAVSSCASRCQQTGGTTSTP